MRIKLAILQLFSLAEGILSCERKGFFFNGDEIMYTKYTGAVVEFAPFTKWTKKGGSKILEENTRDFIALAAEAKRKGADILVYPEYGLTGIETPKDKLDLLTLTQRIPDPEDARVPCLDNESNHTYQALKRLSCAARKYQIYLIINILEWAGQSNVSKDIFYNAQVVLDRSGTLIARYRKVNLFLEENLTPGEKTPNLALFHTDFGVTFTLQICFDLMYKHPALLNILLGKSLDVAMSTAWLNELPFLTAPQIFSGWAKGLGINLLVSNYKDPLKGATGSGIFSEVVNPQEAYIYKTSIRAALLVRDITTIIFQKKDKYSCPKLPNFKRTKRKLKEGSHYLDTNYESEVLIENLSNYSSILLKETQNVSSQMICDEEFCCYVNYSLYAPENGVYQLLAYKGNVYKAKIYKMYVEVCALVYCMNESVSSCANKEHAQSTLISVRSLKADFETSFIYPSILRKDLTLVQNKSWRFTKEPINKIGSKGESRWKGHIVADGVDSGSILVALLYGRNYEKDCIDSN